MLTFDQIITLSDKGFTPDQIVKLTGEELPEPVPEAETEEKPEQKPESGSLSSVLSEAIKGFSSEVAEMKKALQASNIRTVVREDVPPSKSADDILAEIIHPTINKEVSNK